MAVAAPPRPRPRLAQPLTALGGALLGAGVIALLLATGAIGGRTTRVVTQSPPATLARSRGGGLDAEQIYRRDGPGVAFVQSFGRQVGTGSGILLDRKGDVLTNAHVVDGAKRVTVRFDGQSSATSARVVGKDTSNDVAVLRVDPSKVKVDPLPLGDSNGVQVGDAVVAIGNPFGLDRTITSGIVSALQRQITGPNGFTIDHVIQTDAAINPGNSGGPLIDSQGRVVGINSQIATGGGQDANVGIGFAIPIDTAKAELAQLERGGTVAHAFLGVDTTTARGGALIAAIERGGPAAHAGLRPGDVIVSVGGHRVGGSDSLAQVVGALKPGEAAQVRYVRRGHRHAARVMLGARPG